MTRHATASIDLSALAHNFRVLTATAPNAKLWSVIKANAYGHGATRVAQTLADVTDGFAVAHLEEAIALREAGINNPILLMEGVSLSKQVPSISQFGLQIVIHNEAGLTHLLAVKQSPQPIKVWLKVNTGMNRLGFAPEDLGNLIVKVKSTPALDLVGIMTHLACADEPEHPMNAQQIRCFDQQATHLDCDQSIANSAAVLALPGTHRQWIRPGIALYGSSPFPDQDAHSLGLKPAMHLTSRVIAVRNLGVGDSVGYGSTWRADTPMQMAVIGIGYADGYPRSIQNGHIYVNNMLCPLIGRVSMDMCVVKVPKQRGVSVGDTAECWGQHISVDAVAEQSGTISYELLCKVTSRVPRVYSESGV